jgi:hypothetical protein
VEPGADARAPKPEDIGSSCADAGQDRRTRRWWNSGSSAVHSGDSTDGALWPGPGNQLGRPRTQKRVRDKERAAVHADATVLALRLRVRQRLEAIPQETFPVAAAAKRG